MLHLRRHPPAPAVPQRVDAVLLSHLHYDHLDLPSLRLLPDEVHVLAPAGAAALLRRAGLRHVDQLVAGDAAEVAGIRVDAVRAVHDRHRRPFGPVAEPIGFVAHGDRSVYFAGDTDLFPEMSELSALDLALLPVAGWGPSLGVGHMDAERAAQAAAQIAPRMAVPIHWGTLYPRGRRRGGWFHRPPHEFSERVADLSPEVEVRILAPGSAVDL